MLWFLRGIRRGVVTTRYPRGTDPWARALPSPPAFDPARLDGPLVRRLVAGCPSGALSRDDGFLVLDLGRCTACGHCAEVAGDAARASGHFELATRRRDRLIKRIAIEGGER